MSSEAGYQRQDGTICPWGEIIVDGGLIEIYLNPNQDEVAQYVDALMCKVAEAASAIGFNLSKNPAGFIRTMYDSLTGNYLLVDISAACTDSNDPENPYRNIFIRDSDTLQIEGTIANTPWSPDSHSYLLVTTRTYHIQIFPRYIRLYTETQEALVTPPDILAAITQEAEKIRGVRVDPFEVLYGDMTEAQLIRAYLGRDIVVDPELEIVIRLENLPENGRDGVSITGTKYDYQRTLELAKTKLRENIWSRYSNFTLPRRMKTVRL